MTTAEKRLRVAASISTLAVMLLLTAPCQASITISTGATQYMNCSGGVCSPTADKAVLNVADLEKLLESGATTVTTTGSGGIQAGDIFVAAALTWTSTNALTLDANRSLVIERPVSVDGVAGLNLVFNTGGKGGPLEFRNQGHVTFSKVSSALTINGTVYVLVDSVQSLASAVANNAYGNFALSRSYDASGDGTYSSSPVQTSYYGNLEGLGNQIQSLSISEGECANTGLFSEQKAGVISDIGIVNANISFSGSCQDDIGTLVGLAYGTISRSYSSGSVVADYYGQVGGLVGYIAETGDVDHSHSSASMSGSDSSVGGLIGDNEGKVADSYATGSVSDNSGYPSFDIGGLAGYNVGEISSSFATGSIYSPNNGYCGGFVGVAEVEIIDSYATGSASCGSTSDLGGFAGEVFNDVRDSYSTGSVEGSSEETGGFAGVTEYGYMKSDFWDTTTSGRQNGTGYGHKKGLKGLTTQRFQSGLPAGFSPKIWAEDSDINNGFPYLIANPPPK